MRSIVFHGTATRRMSEEELASLWRERAEIESHVEITGMLLHKAGEFLQVIEGPNAVIRDMYARILADPRNKEVRTISDRFIVEREFEGQPMGFLNLDELPAQTPLTDGFSYEAFSVEPESALRTLRYFRYR